MTVTELIAALSEFPPDLLVVSQSGFMQERCEVRGVERGEPGQVAWTHDINFIEDGNWVEVY